MESSRVAITNSIPSFLNTLVREITGKSTEKMMVLVEVLVSLQNATRDEKTTQGDSRRPGY